MVIWYTCTIIIGSEKEKIVNTPNGFVVLEFPTKYIATMRMRYNCTQYTWGTHSEAGYSTPCLIVWRVIFSQQSPGLWPLG